MAGSKRARVKKALSPRNDPPPPQITPEDDDDLMDDLLASLDSRNETVQAESSTVLQEMQEKREADVNSGKSSKERFKERQARKAAAMENSYTPDNPEYTAKLELEAKEEETSIKKTCNSLGVEIYEINPDGHCLFSAIADQLALLGILSPSEADYASIRYVASTYMWEHVDDFLPFLPSTGGEDTEGANTAGLMSIKQYEQYCVAIRDTGVWGGEPEIQALSRAYNVPIHVIQGGVPPVVVHDPSGSNTDDIHIKRALRISYHRRMYGLGEASNHTY
ncbi:hypothetical protein CPB85DRAFT_1428347 [Mucidula mucida]|nr:hypothetical protein CPB85DRAFT_1428347 [Mucidula mucida]